MGERLPCKQEEGVRFPPVPLGVTIAMDEQEYDPAYKHKTLTLEQFVREYGPLRSHDIDTYSLALAAVEQLSPDDPIAAIAVGVVAGQDVFEEEWRKLGGLR